MLPEQAPLYHTLPAQLPLLLWFLPAPAPPFHSVPGSEAFPAPPPEFPVSVPASVFLLFSSVPELLPHDGVSILPGNAAFPHPAQFFRFPVQTFLPSQSPLRILPTLFQRLSFLPAIPDFSETAFLPALPLPVFHSLRNRRLLLFWMPIPFSWQPEPVSFSQPPAFPGLMFPPPALTHGAWDAPGIRRQDRAFPASVLLSPGFPPEHHKTGGSCPSLPPGAPTSSGS